jgi:hypothetical protein
MTLSAIACRRSNRTSGRGPRAGSASATQLSARSPEQFSQDPGGHEGSAGVLAAQGTHIARRRGRTTVAFRSVQQGNRMLIVEIVGNLRVSHVIWQRPYPQNRESRLPYQPPVAGRSPVEQDDGGGGPGASVEL